MIVNVWPPAVIVPVLAGPFIACTLNETVPFPLPLLPPVMEIHPSLLAAVHVQLATVVIEKLLFTPFAETLMLVGETA